MELAGLDAFCHRALDDPDAEPQDGDEAAAVARYARVPTSQAQRVWKREGREKYGRL